MKKLVKDHAVAFWGGVAAFASNVVALKVVDAFNGPQVWHFVGIFLASLFVGCAVYARERLGDARIEKLDQARKEHWTLENEEELEALKAKKEAAENAK